MSRGGFVPIHMDVVSAVLLRLFLALDEAQKIGLTAVEMRVFEMPWFGVTIASENSLLKMRDLVETIHVKLSNEGSELLMLEPATENLSSETFMIEDYISSQNVMFSSLSIEFNVKSG